MKNSPLQDKSPKRLFSAIPLVGIFVLGFLFGFIASDSLRQRSVRATPSAGSSARPEIYFSPDGRIQNRLADLISSSRTSIDIAIFDLTAAPLADALIKAHQRGVNVRMVADKRQSKGERSRIPVLLQSGLDVHIRSGGKGGIMHNKFAIFDGRLLFTGSYNWTQNAEFRNFENAVFTTDPDVIFSYQKEFDVLFNR